MARSPRGRNSRATAQAPALPWDQFALQQPVSPAQSEPVVVIGAGLAGCWMARTLAEAGVNVQVLEAGPGAASGASSNPAGIAKPFVTRGGSLAMNFYIQAHEYLRQTLRNWSLEEACQYCACGVIQLVDRPFEASKHFDNISGRQLQEALRMPYSGHGLRFANAGWLNPSALCQSLLVHERIALRTQSQAQSIERGADAKWHIHLQDQTCFRTRHVVIASGVALNKLALTAHLDVIPARGQISRFSLANAAHTRTSPPARAPAHVVSGKHYLIPDGDTVIVGATFERNSLDASVRADDDESNRAGLASMLPQLQIQDAIDAFAGIRATTPDRLPLVGPLSDACACNDVYANLHHGRKLRDYPVLPIQPGIFILGGLGSRGIVTAPFAAHLLADYMIGGECIAEWASLTNPARFQIRRLKRCLVA